MSAWWESSPNTWDNAAAAAGDSWSSWDAQDARSGDKGDSWNSWGGDAGSAETSSWPQSWGASQGDTGAAGSSNAGYSWDNKGESADAQAWPAPTGKAFWQAQQYNKESNVIPRKEDWELEQDDGRLFQERLGSSAGIDFERYDSVPVDISGNKSSHIPVMSTFEEIYSEFSDCIPEALVNNVRKCQYQRPTPVQKYAVPVGLVGRDIMCCAQTGSGKTAAFLLPIIGRMMSIHSDPVGLMDVPFEGKCSPDTLILTPTRELCIQIHEEALKFCHRTSYRCCRVYGGEATKIQLEDLARGCDLMVACPGRLKDFIDREVVSVEKVYILVLDEADRMLDMGFEKQIRAIVDEHGMSSKDGRQTMMFSATFPDECQRMAQDFLYDYIWIGVGIVGGAAESVVQSLVQVQPSGKYEKLVETLDQFFQAKDKDERALIFVNAKDTAKWLDEQLFEKNFDTGALHGNLTQEERESNLKRFRSGQIDVMVATDVAARGLDIEKVAMVVNYDMPNEVDTYVHRIGRSGRIGNRGQAVTFIATDEYNKPYENSDVLKKLHGVMRDAKSEVPDWLEGATAETAGGQTDSWSGWGGRDMRGWASTEMSAADQCQ